MLTQVKNRTITKHSALKRRFNVKATIFALCFSWYLDLRLKFFGCRETADFLFLYLCTAKSKKD